MSAGAGLRASAAALAISIWQLTGVSHAETTDAESKIVAVTVFPDRAGITREASVTLAEGDQTIEIGPLPGGLEPSSVSARGAGESDVTLYGVRLVTRQLEGAQDPKAERFEEAIRKLQQDQRQLQNTKQVIEQERTYLASIQAASGEQIGKDLVTRAPSATDAAALLAFIHDSLTRILEQERDADKELEESGRELDRLRRELAALTHGRARQETVLAVDVGAPKAGRFQLQVSYRLPGASWEPAYEARAISTVGSVELAASALVRQQTGEEWSGVQLTLSTAQPSIAGSMPELEPWFLRPYEPMAMKQSMVARAPAAEALYDENLSKSLSEEKDKFDDARANREARVAQAAVLAQGPAVTYRLPQAVSIPSDWQPRKVPITVSTLNAQLAYESTPRLVTHAFLRAKVANTTDQLFLPGSVAVFLDGAYVATAALKQVAPGETFDLYLGADERVRVERKQLKERVEVSLLPGLRGKIRSTDYEFLTTIENFTGRRITLTVFDQTPVSEREEIVVESVKAAPGEIKRDQEKPGVFQWTLELAPTQKQELRLSYRVRHPVDLQVF